MTGAELRGRMEEGGRVWGDKRDDSVGEGQARGRLQADADGCFERSSTGMVDGFVVLDLI